MDNAATTSSAILGPFWRSDTPVREFGSTTTFDTPPDAEVAYIHGTVTDAVTGEPLQNALVDVWQCSTNGMSHSLTIPIHLSRLTFSQACTNSKIPTNASSIFAANFIATSKGNMLSTASARSHIR